MPVLSPFRFFFLSLSLSCCLKISCRLVLNATHPYPSLSFRVCNSCWKKLTGNKILVIIVEERERERETEREHQMKRQNNKTDHWSKNRSNNCSDNRGKKERKLIQFELSSPVKTVNNRSWSGVLLIQEEILTSGLFGTHRINGWRWIRHARLHRHHLILFLISQGFSNCLLLLLLIISNTKRSGWYTAGKEDDLWGWWWCRSRKSRSGVERK